MQLDKIYQPIGIASGITTVTVGAYTLGVDMRIAAGVAAVAVLGLIGLVSLLGRRQGRYDVSFLERLVELDFLSPDAETVRQTRRNKIRSMRDNVVFYDTHMSADGGLEELTVDCGVLSEIRREGGDLFVRTQFPRPLRKGEIVDTSLTCVLRESFSDPNREYWSVRISHPTTSCRIVLKFHRDRLFKSYRGYDRFTTHESMHKSQPAEQVIDGRPCLVWDIERPKVGHVYKIVWEW